MVMKGDDVAYAYTHICTHTHTRSRYITRHAYKHTGVVDKACASHGDERQTHTHTHTHTHAHMPYTRHV
jgi:hypothetical protein